MLQVSWCCTCKRNRVPVVEGLAVDWRVDEGTRETGREGRRTEEGGYIRQQPAVLFRDAYAQRRCGPWGRGGRGGAVADFRAQLLV